METQYEISTKFHEIFAVVSKGGGHSYTEQYYIA